MGSGSKGQTTTTTSPNPAANRAYKEVLNRASEVASTPYQAYTGELVAPINAQQQAGIANINQNAGFAQPYIEQAGQYVQNAAGPLNWQQWMSPYTQQVVDATMAQFAEQNAQQRQGVLGNAIAQNALGGDRVGVAQANLARQQSLAEMPVIAGLYSQGYQQALATAQQQQQNQMAAAYGLGNLGVAGQNAALTGAGAQFGVGSAEQQTEQARLNALYGQFQQAQAFPYAQTQWLAGINTGVGSQMGGTSVTQAPPPNPWSQVLGLGIAGLGVAGGLGWQPLAARGGRIPGLATGGIPGQSAYPDWGVGYVPSMQITPGKGVPAGTAAPASGGLGTSFKDAMSIANMIKGGGGLTSPTMTAPGIDQPIMTLGAAGDYAVPTFTTPEAGFSPFSGFGWAQGGFVPMTPDAILVPRSYQEGGVPRPDDPLSAQNWLGYEISDMDTGAPQGAGTFDEPIEPPPPPVGTPPIAPAAPGVEYAGVAPQNAPVPVSGLQAIQRVAPGPEPEPLPEGAMAFDAPVGGFAPAAPAAAPAGRNIFGLPALSPEARQGLIAAGLGMMASRSPYLGVAVGEGGQHGLAAYTGAQKQAREERRLDTQVKALQERATRAQEELNERTRHNKEMEKKADWQMRKPVQVGTDQYGAPIFKVWDKDKNDWVDPIKPKETQPTTQTPQSDKVSAADIELPPGAKLTSGTIGTLADPIDQRYNPDVLANEPPEQANMVKAIAEGRRKPPSMARPNPYNRRIMELVTLYAPDWDETAFARRQRTANEFAAGVASRNINSIKTLAGHLGDLYKSTIELNNTRFKIINAVKQGTQGQWDQEYQRKLADYEAKAEAVANEGPKVFAGTQSALADREEWRNRLLGSTEPYAKQISSIRSIVDLVESRIGAMADTYNQGMSTRHKPSDLIDEKSRKVFDTLRNARGETAPTSVTKAPPAERYKQLTGEGMSKADAYKKLREEGY